MPLTDIEPRSFRGFPPFVKNVKGPTLNFDLHRVWRFGMAHRIPGAVRSVSAQGGDQGHERFSQAESAEKDRRPWRADRDWRLATRHADGTGGAAHRGALDRAGGPWVCGRGPWRVVD